MPDAGGQADLLSRDWQVGLTTIYDPWNLIRQYCGLPFKVGGRDYEPETWAFAYFDRVEFPGWDRPRPVDVLASSTLSATARFEHLEFFVDHGFDLLGEWARDLPTGLRLADAPEEVLAKVGELNELTDEVPLSLLSKVAFRLRPELIPIYEATTASLYRKRTGGRGEASWPNLVREMAVDLGQEKNPAIDLVQREIFFELEPTLRMPYPISYPTSVRLLDIALFMAGTFGFHEEDRLERIRRHAAERDEVRRRRLEANLVREQLLAESYEDAWDFSLGSDDPGGSTAFEG